MKVHYEREQSICRFKDYSVLKTQECDKVVKIDGNLEEMVKEILEAAKADHYELTSAHLYFSKENKRRRKRQTIDLFGRDYI